MEIPLFPFMVLGCSISLGFAADFSVDLSTGQYSGDDNSTITWVSPPYTPPAVTAECPIQGLLKLTFDKEERRRAEIKLVFGTEVKAFAFNVGDSLTNDAWSGDDGTQSNDAEAHAFYRQLNIAGRDRRRSSLSGSYGILYRSDFDYNFLTGNVTLNVKDQYFQAFSKMGIVLYESRELFALKGQKDKDGPENFDIYLGLNRVIFERMAGRIGTGLCHAEVTWHKF